MLSLLGLGRLLNSPLGIHAAHRADLESDAAAGAGADGGRRTGGVRAWKKPGSKAATAAANAARPAAPAAAKAAKAAAKPASGSAAGLQPGCDVAHLKAFRPGAGSSIVELGHILGFAHTSGFRRVALPNFPSNLTGIFKPARTILLPASDNSSCSGLAPACRHLRKLWNGSTYVSSDWHASFCKLSNAQMHEVFEKHAHPLLTEQCKKVMDARRASPDILTVHLPSDRRLFADSRMYWVQAPCSFYEKVVNETAGITKVLVVAESLSHPCAKWLHSRPLPRGVSVELQSTSVWQDWCSLAGAVNLVVSPSPFSHTAAVFGSPRNIYMCNNAFVEEWPLRCSAQPVPRIVRYFPPKDVRKQYKSWTSFAEGIPAQALGGPQTCKPIEGEIPILRCEMASLAKYRSGAGNQMSELGHILGFAHASGMRTVYLPSSVALLKGIVNQVSRIDMPPTDKSPCTGLPRECAHMHKVFSPRSQMWTDGHWYAAFCRFTHVAVMHEAYQLYAAPMLTDQCKRVMEAQQALPGTLTVHLRAGDLSRREMFRYERQPPCSYFEKLLRDNPTLNRILVVAESKEHPCVRWLSSRTLPRRVRVEVQRKTIWEDWCTMAGAVNIAVAPSSLSHTAAVFGSPRNIYVFDDFYFGAWPLRCDTEPVSKTWRYLPPSGWKKKYGNWSTYAVNAPVQDLVGPLNCTAGKKSVHRDMTR